MRSSSRYLQQTLSVRSPGFCIMKWNPFSSSFATFDSQLRLYEVITLPNGSRDAVLSKSISVISGEGMLSGVTTLDWAQDISLPKALVFGTSVGSVYFLNWSRAQQQPADYLTLRQGKKSKPQCTEVAWNRFHFPNQVAAGFERSKKCDHLPPLPYPSRPSRPPLSYLSPPLCLPPP